MRSPVMKVIGVLLIVLVMLSVSRGGQRSRFGEDHPLSAWYEQSAVSEWSLFTQSGMALEIKIEASEEIKICLGFRHWVCHRWAGIPASWLRYYQRGLRSRRREIMAF